MKKKLFLFFLFFIVFTLIACNSVNEEMILLDNVTSISISESQRYGALNKDYIATYTQKEILSNFEEIIKNAKGTQRNIIDDINEDKPHYDLLVRYENGDTHLLHLILGKKRKESIFMYIGHEENPYYISPEETQNLREIINRH